MLTKQALFALCRFWSESDDDAASETDYPIGDASSEADCDDASHDSSSSDVTDSEQKYSTRIEVEPEEPRTVHDLGVEERLQLVRTAPWAAFELAAEEYAMVFKLGADAVCEVVSIAVIKGENPYTAGGAFDVLFRNGTIETLSDLADMSLDSEDHRFTQYDDAIE